MTTKDEALKLALKALELTQSCYEDTFNEPVRKAIQACRAALAEQDSEPVAMVPPKAKGVMTDNEYHCYRLGWFESFVANKRTAQQPAPAVEADWETLSKWWESGDENFPNLKQIVMNMLSAAQPTPAVQPQILAAFDAVVAAELPRVTTLEYNSHEICKHFASKLRERLAKEEVPEAPAVQPKGLFIDMIAEHEGLADELKAIDREVDAVVLDAYDAGLLGGNWSCGVEWWHDYISAELGRAHDFYQSQVDSLTAPQPLTVPQGWKLVPVKPTDAQYLAGTEIEGSEFTSAKKIYRAMLAAAPQAPAVQPMTDEQKRAGFRQKEEEWTFRGMTPWQVWLKACAWTEAAHGIGAPKEDV